MKGKSMSQGVALAELWRGNTLESCHYGHVVICTADGAVVDAWGDPERVIYPRSSCKMIQALPLIESGAADRFGLTSSHLALSCASHIGAAYHTEPVATWTRDLGLSEPDFRCGPQMPSDTEARVDLNRTGTAPCQFHNNCSGKHCGFLTLNKHIGGGPEYIDPCHPVQQAVRASFEEVTGVESPGHGIDGCSAPNFLTTMRGLATAAARFATAGETDTRGKAMVRLREAMMAHPELVAGNGMECTELMQASAGTVALKTGAEGVYLGIVPALGLGIAVKAEDGAKRAAAMAITAVLVRLGALEAAHPTVAAHLNRIEHNRRGIAAAILRPGGSLA